MKKHTPGPWRIEQGSEKGRVHTTYHLEVWSSIVRIAKLDDPIRYSEEANARLIAAAPDLLAACEAIMDLVEAGECSDGYAASLVRAAIAKAQGDSDG